MKSNTKGQKTVNLSEYRELVSMKAQAGSPGLSERLPLGRILPLTRPIRDRKPASASKPGNRNRVQELKEKIESGRYRVESLQLAERMIRDALIEDLSKAKTSEEENKE